MLNSKGRRTGKYRVAFQKLLVLSWNEGISTGKRMRPNERTVQSQDIDGGTVHTVYPDFTILLALDCVV